jgi:hypothetical protein
VPPRWQSQFRSPPVPAERQSWRRSEPARGNVAAHAPGMAPGAPGPHVLVNRRPGPPAPACVSSYR